MYIVDIKKKAQRELLALPKKDQLRVLGAMEILSKNPFVGKKLHGEYTGAWSLRVWPYRIIYTIHQHIVTVTVVAIGHRQGVYKNS